MALNLADLNEDVLTEIISHLSSADASTLSRTSRALHPFAIRQMLSVVEIEHLQSLAGFCAYALADIPGRLRWVRDLTVNIHDWPFALDVLQAALGPLLRVLEHPSECALARLSLNPMQLFDSGNQRGWSQALRDAVSALPQLMEMELRSYSMPLEDEIAWVRMLCSSHPKLRTLSLNLHHPAGWPMSAVSQHLQSFQDIVTLEIGITGSPLGDNSPRIQFPSVRNLSLSIYDVPLPLIAAMFPNIRTLHIRRAVGNLMPGPEDTAVSGPLWASLDLLNIPAPYVAQITCPVHWLDVPHMPSAHAFWEPRLGTGVAPPAVVTAPAGSDAHLDAFLENLMGDVKVLELSVASREPGGVVTFARRIVSRLVRGPSKLVGLRLVSRVGTRPPGSAVSDRTDSELSAAALALASGIESLRFVWVGEGKPLVSGVTHRKGWEVCWKVMRARRHDGDTMSAMSGERAARLDARIRRFGCDFEAL